MTPEEVKKRLKIETFRELSGDKVVELIKSMRGTDPETRKLVIAPVSELQGLW